MGEEGEERGRGRAHPLTIEGRRAAEHHIREKSFGDLPWPRFAPHLFALQQGNAQIGPVAHD
jgi:hypothetical protein